MRHHRPCGSRRVRRETETGTASDHHRMASETQQIRQRRLLLPSGQKARRGTESLVDDRRASRVAIHDHETETLPHALGSCDDDDDATDRGHERRIKEMRKKS